jgi:hypothetical protein
MRTTFLVGKVTRRGAEMVVVDELGASPFPGPWSLKALVRPKPVARPSMNVATERIH